MAGPNIGDLAPEFTLPGTGDRQYSLSEYRGRKVVLAFYPGDFTPACTAQLCSYRDAWADLEGLDAIVLGISTQDVESHERFTEKHKFPFPLLADTDKAIAKAYGVVGPLGVRRAVFVLDGNGIVRWKHVALLGVTYKGPQTLIGALNAISA
ncbi:MAG: peroxiredoxin [Acidimicrobiia bacterium]